MDSQRFKCGSRSKEPNQCGSGSWSVTKIRIFTWKSYFMKAIGHKTYLRRYKSLLKLIFCNLGIVKHLQNIVAFAGWLHLTAILVWPIYLSSTHGFSSIYSSFMPQLIEEGSSSRWKSSLKIWLYSFFFPARSFYWYHSKFSCCKLLPKNRRNKDKSS